MSPAAAPPASGRFLIRLSLLILPLFLLSLLATRTSRGQGGTPGPSFYCNCIDRTGVGPWTYGDPVELWYGKLFFEQTDLAVGGAVPMELRRGHATLDYSPGPFGPGTSLGTDWF